MEGFKRSYRIWVFGLSYLCGFLLLTSCGSNSQSLQGGSLARAQLQITPFPNFDFGSVQVGKSASQTFHVVNVGSLAATSLNGDFYLNINFEYEGGTFPGTSGTCGTDLAPKDSCDVSVVFSPQYSSTFSQPLQLHYSDAAKNWVTDTPIMTGLGY